MADIGQVDIGEMTMRYGEEEAARLMEEIIKNNKIIIKTQKQLEGLLVEVERKRQQKDREIERRREKEQEETDKWMEECRKRNEKEREEREEKKRVEKEWRKIESMRIREERRAEKEWRKQEKLERRREERRQIAMEERKCFACGGFEHMAYSCRNMGKEEPVQVSSNRFEVLKVRVMQRGEGSGKKVAKDRREILREEKAKRVVEKKEKKEKLLREVTVKIGLKQEEEEEGIVTEALLDSGATGLVMSEEFVRRHKFKRTRLKRLVYMRNVDGTLNYAGPIVDTVEVEIFFRGHKERASIDVIGGQKWSVILGMLWLRRHNPEIDWKTGEIKITRCPDECGKRWKTGRQTKLGWKKQEEKEEKERKRPTIEEEKMIARIVEEKENKEEDLIELRATEEMVPRRFYKYLKMFEKKDSERMPTRKTWNHAIDLREGFVPKKGKIYSLSRVEREEVQEFVKDQLRKGYIRPSKSPQMSPVFFVPKKDGKKRMVQDYRYLNSWTIKNNYPLPLISDLIDSIGKKKVFTKMDLRWGYNNVRIKEGDEWKAAFSTPEGSFEPTVIFFGLTNSPATFQAMMNDLLRDLVVEEKVAVFIDNVMVATETEEGHDEIVEEVLRRLEENDLFVKPKKCVWKVREVGFLGVIIGENGVRMEKEKMQGVIEWLVPKSVKDVQKFLELANYYRWFVKDFAKIAKPLHEMTRKENKWSWGERQQKAFEELKERFTTEPVLVTPDLDKEMRVEADASDFATGGVLSMKCEDEKWRPVAYISKLLNEAERNYEIHDKEMLAIIQCLEA